MARASRLARRSGRAGVSGVRLTNKGEIALDQIVTFGRPVFCGNATLAAQPLPHQARLESLPPPAGNPTTMRTAAPDSLAPKQSVRRPAARPHRGPNAEIAGGEVSW